MIVPAVLAAVFLAVTHADNIQGHNAFLVTLPPPPCTDGWQLYSTQQNPFCYYSSRDENAWLCCPVCPEGYQVTQMMKAAGQHCMMVFGHSEDTACCPACDATSTYYDTEPMGDKITCTSHVSGGFCCRGTEANAAIGDRTIHSEDIGSG